jgi:hypothetical protein
MFLTQMEVVMDMSSDLEHMVETDMILQGYNPYDPVDINTYWEVYFNGY